MRKELIRVENLSIHNKRNDHSANLMFQTIFKSPGDFFSFSTAQRSTKETEVVCHPNYLTVSGESQAFYFDTSQCVRLGNSVVKLILISSSAEREFQKIDGTDLFKEYLRISGWSCHCQVVRSNGVSEIEIAQLVKSCD
jgi:hypothetical protein